MQLALLAAPRADGALIGSDGVAYYVWLRSAVIDRDLDLANDFGLFRRAYPVTLATTPTGMVANKYAVGPAILWSPFFLVAHGVSWILGLPTNGVTYSYQAAILFGSLVYGACGIALAAYCAQDLADKRSVSATVFVFWLTGNLVYYLVVEPSMPHGCALFAVSLALTAWWVWLRPGRIPTFKQAVALGGAAGLVLLVRLQDAPALVPMGIALIGGGYRSLTRRDTAALGNWLRAGLVCGLAALIVFLPQLLTWQSVYGTWFATPYLADHDPPFYWLQPHIVGVLFSTFHGLFTWHPIYLVSFAGLVWAAVAPRTRSSAPPTDDQSSRAVRYGVQCSSLLLVIALHTYLIAAWWSWWQGDSFGGRMFVDITWIWIIGVALAIQLIRTRPHLTRIAIGVTLFLTLWNGLSLAQYRLGLVPRSDYLTIRQLTVDRLLLPWQLIERRLRR